MGSVGTRRAAGREPVLAVVRWLRSRWARVTAGRDAGFSAVEAVVVIPVAVILTMLVVQAAMVWFGRNVALHAAQQGVATARVYHAAPGVGRARTEKILAGTAEKLLSEPSVHVARGGRRVTVTVEADVATVVPFGHFTTHVHASGPIERFTAGTG
jgi:hypothetical protein